MYKLKTVFSLEFLKVRLVEVAKKSSFLSGPTTKALPLSPPPPIELSGHPFFGTFFRA